MNIVHLLVWVNNQLQLAQKQTITVSKGYTEEYKKENCLGIENVYNGRTALCSAVLCNSFSTNVLKVLHSMHTQDKEQRAPPEGNARQ